MSLSREQLELRRYRIGASEIASIVDLYRPEGTPRLDLYKTALDVFMEKVLPPAEEAQPEEHQVWGLHLEPAIIVHHAHASGYELLAPPDGLKTWPSITHPTLPLIATPDALARCADGLVGIQAKNDQGWSSLEWGEPGTDSAPLGYVSQATFEIGVLRARAYELVRDDIAVSRRGAPPVAYPVPFDPDLFGQLAEIAAKFKRDHLDTLKPPPGEPKVEAEYVRRRYPKEQVRGLDPTAELEALVQSVRTMRATKKAVLEDLLVAETALKKAIGEAAGVEGLCTWKLEGKFTTYSVTKKPTRVLRLVGAKEE